RLARTKTPGQLPLRWELTHPFSSTGHPLGPGHSTRTTTATNATRTRRVSGTDVLRGRDSQHSTRAQNRSALSFTSIYVPIYARRPGRRADVRCARSVRLG